MVVPIGFSQRLGSVVIEPPPTVFKKSGEMCARLFRYLDITSLRGAATRDHGAATIERPTLSVLWGGRAREYIVHDPVRPHLSDRMGGFDM